MNGLRRYLILSALLLVGYLVAQYYKPIPTDWTPTYLKEDKIPFGLYILNREIHDLFPAADISTSGLRVYNVLKGNEFKNTNYLFVASSLDMDKLDVKALLNYIAHGNNVFIATFNAGKILSDTLKLETRSYLNYAKEKSAPVNFTNPSLRSSRGYLFNKGIGDQYFSKFDTLRVTVLGKSVKNDANFIRYTFGNGRLYILPNPQLLTNYNLLNPAGAEYAAKALSYLPPVKKLIWDEHNTRAENTDSSVLRVIFNHQQLRWAYYLALIGLVTFVLFEMKRRQRIIPVIEPLKNTSAGFVKVVGKIYYQQRDNRNIASKKVNYFLEYIRSTYRLKTTIVDAELETILGIRSGVSQEIIKKLFDIINQINNNGAVDDDLLINFNKLTEQFYKQAQ